MKNFYQPEEEVFLLNKKKTYIYLSFKIPVAPRSHIEKYWSILGKLLDAILAADLKAAIAKYLNDLEDDRGLVQTSIKYIKCCVADVSSSIVQM